MPRLTDLPALRLLLGASSDQQASRRVRRLLHHNEAADPGLERALAGLCTALQEPLSAFQT